MTSKKDGDKGEGYKVYRNPATGKFVSKEYAKRHPKNAIPDTVERSSRSSRG
jgi:hypothetical protein